jgi:TRAP transporter 4TM/12TM fusion protein
MMLVFVFYPANKNSPKDRFTLLDCFFMLLVIICVSYFIMNYAQFFLRFNVYTTYDMVFAWMLILLSLESARRGTGMAVPLLAIAMILYATTWVGPHLRGLIAHRGYSLTRIGIFLYTSLSDGLFGVVANTLATFVMPFVLFGAFMARTGVGQFFVDLPYALFGGMRGGAAIVTVVAGMLIGMLSGSPVACVLTIGAFVLPLMKKSGYDSETSGAIASAVSCGSMFTPPVLGAAVFFMVEFTGIPYIEIITFALLPSALFYLGILTQATLNAKKLGMKGLANEDLPDWKVVLKKGWYLSTPLFVLVIVLSMDYSPTISALWASFCCIVVSMFNAQNRMTPTKLFNAMAQATLDLMIIACVAGAIGIVIGMLALTGLGSKFATILIQFAGGQLFLTIVLAALASTIVGLGIPITASYIILAMLIPPALVQLGVSVAAAHLMLIWFSQLSGITPPVCLVAYGAAALCDGDPIKTGIRALRYGATLLFIPLMFVYTRILDVGTWGWAFDSVTAVIAVLFFSGFMQGYWSRKNHVIESLILGASAFGLFTPNPVWNVLGLVGGLSVWAWQRYTMKKQNLMVA